MSSKSVPSDIRYSKDASLLNAKANGDSSKLLEEPRNEAGHYDTAENDQSNTTVVEIASNSKDVLKGLRVMQAGFKTITEQANQSHRTLSKLIEDVEKDGNQDVTGELAALHPNLRNISEVCKQVSSHVEAFQGSSNLQDVKKEYSILIHYYAAFCEIVRDVSELAHHCVPKKIISPEDVEELCYIRNPTKQVILLLKRVIGPVKSGRPQVLYDLLDIMEQYGLQATQQFASEVKRSLKAKPRSGDDDLVQLYKMLCSTMYKLQCNNMEQGDKKCASDTIQGIQQELKQLLKRTHYQAICDFTAQQVDEISFTKGDVIKNLCFCNVDGWMIGSVEKTGMQGKFPLNCVRRIT